MTDEAIRRVEQIWTGSSLEVADIFVPPFPPFREKGDVHLHELKNMTSRNDDVIICANGKAGTHWLQEIIQMIFHQKAEYMKAGKEKFMFECQFVEDLDKLQSPRIMNTHLPFRHLPDDFIRKRGKILFITRNPKDTVVSLYNHLYNMRNMATGSTFDEPFEALLPVIMNKKLERQTGYVKYHREWAQILEEKPEYPILHITFEDMKENPLREIQRLSTFLEKPCSDSFLELICNKCNFQSMKRANEEYKDDMSKAFSRDGKQFMFRKGEVGDWKNWFTVAQNEKFDAWFLEEMKGCNLKFRYEI